MKSFNEIKDVAKSIGLPVVGVGVVIIVGRIIYDRVSTTWQTLREADLAAEIIDVEVEETVE